MNTKRSRSHAQPASPGAHPQRPRTGPADQARPGPPDDPPGYAARAAQGPFGIDTGLARLNGLAQRLERFDDELLRRDCFRVISGRRRCLERRQRLPSEHPVARVIDIAHGLLRGDCLRYGTYPKSDLLADLRTVSRRRNKPD